MPSAVVSYVPTASEDLDLARRHAQGDASAFDEVYGRFGSMVYTLALRLTGDADTASDVHQEAFLRIYKSLGRFRGRSSLKTWVYSVTLNCGRSRLKRRYRRATVAVADGFFEAQPDRRAGPERRALARDAGRHLQRALLALPGPFRVAVVLRDMEGLSYDEIAVALDVRIGTVRSRIARGRERLRRALEAAR